MRSLMVHADDFGLSDGVVQGILSAMKDGVVTATSAMVCDEGDRERVRRFAPEARGAIGLHLQLTDGRPLEHPGRIPTLVGENGCFPRRREDLKNLDAAEVLLEWRAQLEAFRQLGLQPSHLDTHHSVHGLPGAAAAYRQLALETGVPVRGLNADFNGALRREGIPCADAYVSIWRGGRVDDSSMQRALRAMIRITPEEGFVEFGCHPAVVDGELARRSRYVEQREQELAILRAPGLREQLLELGYRLAAPEALATVV